MHVLVTNFNSGNKSIVFDLVSLRECRAVPDFPFRARYTASASVQGSPVVCGGMEPSKARIGNCYINEGSPNFSWRKLTDHIRGRYMHAAVALGDRLWLTGGAGVVTYANGQGTPTGLDLTEFISLDGTVERGPNLPKYLDSHCMIKLTDGRVMILGGVVTIRNLNDVGKENYYPTKKVLIYHPDTMDFTDGPSMLNNRSSFACAYFYSRLHGGRPVALAVGGNLGRAEVLDYTLEKAKWQESKFAFN